MGSLTQRRGDTGKPTAWHTSDSCVHRDSSPTKLGKSKSRHHFKEASRPAPPGPLWSQDREVRSRCPGDKGTRGWGWSARVTTAPRAWDPEARGRLGVLLETESPGRPRVGLLKLDPVLGEAASLTPPPDTQMMDGLETEAETGQRTRGPRAPFR